MCYNPLHCLPSSAELPDSDDTPVDNELQNLIPNLLDAILVLAWGDGQSPVGNHRTDWFFGVDMGSITRRVSLRSCPMVSSALG